MPILPITPSLTAGSSHPAPRVPVAPVAPGVPGVPGVPVAPISPLRPHAPALCSGAELRQLREARGLSRPALARLIGYSQWTIKAWELGHRLVPASLAPALYEALDGVAADLRAARARLVDALAEAWAG